MSGVADYSVSDAAVRQARSCGFWEATEARVRGIAARAVPIDHPAGNATYGPYLLLLVGTRVESFSLIGPQELDTRPITQCRICHGLLTIPIRSTIDGREGIAHRPCPRAFDNTQPLCDAKRSKPHDS